MSDFTSRLKYVKLGDVLSVFLFLFAVIPSIIIKRIHLALWLICEDENEARDNGYWLYKHIKEKHPEIDAVYAINKKSPDYQKVKILGKVIQYGSLTHWIYYLAADKNISSQKGGKPNAALCYLLEIYGFLKNKRIFLQHGITINDTKWLHYEVTKVSLFICAAKPEYDYVKNHFKYPNENIKLLGFCRYDNLNNGKVNRKQILIMPTWRGWLARPAGRSKEYDNIDDFTKTGYFRHWNALLNNAELGNYLAKDNLKVVFFPHRNMQKFIGNFGIKSSNIIIAGWREYDVQELLNESAFLITDYSSISMDFAYMKKPLMYYQFDQEEFRTGQYGEGYFSYRNSGFGEVVTKEHELVSLIGQYIKNGFEMKNEYISRVSDFFCFTDRNNCERNFCAIEAL